MNSVQIVPRPELAVAVVVPPPAVSSDDLLPPAPLWLFSDGSNFKVLCLSLDGYP